MEKMRPRLVWVQFGLDLIPLDYRKRDPLSIEEK